MLLEHILLAFGASVIIYMVSRLLNCLVLSREDAGRDPKFLSILMGISLIASFLVSIPLHFIEMPLFMRSQNRFDKNMSEANIRYMWKCVKCKDRSNCKIPLGYDKDSQTWSRWSGHTFADLDIPSDTE